MPGAKPKPGKGPAKPPEWSPDQATRPPDQPLPKGTSPQPPAVPGNDKNSGQVSVHTPSLDLFAANIGALVDMVTASAAQLKALAPLAPGAFYHADVIRANITGDNGDGGIRSKYQISHADLGNGLVAVQEAAKKMSSAYKTTEDLNKAGARDVQTAFNQATGYFQGVVGDVGGTPTSG